MCCKELFYAALPNWTIKPLMRKVDTMFPQVARPGLNKLNYILNNEKALVGMVERDKENNNKPLITCNLLIKRGVSGSNV